MTPTLRILFAGLSACSVLVATASAQVVRRYGGDGADAMARPYGTSPGDENRPAQSGSMRDANGNMVIVDGRVVGAHYSEASPDALTYGVGRGSATGASTNATAVGNLLNVNVTGNNNTVIVTSEQTNNGTQTVILNGGLKLSQ